MRHDQRSHANGRPCNVPQPAKPNTQPRRSPHPRPTCSPTRNSKDNIRPRCQVQNQACQHKGQQIAQWHPQNGIQHLLEIRAFDLGEHRRQNLANRLGIMHVKRIRLVAVDIKHRQQLARRVANRQNQFRSGR